jgi:hypothetical protein
VRPPHGRAPALTRPSATVRLLRSTLLVTVLAFALAAAGCGSGGSDVPEVPGPPAELTVPHVKGAADLSEDASATPTATPSADATETPTPATGTTGSTGTTGTTGTGGTTAATPTPAAQQQDSASNDTKPADGSPPQQFEQFCQENAGAC